MQTLLQQQTRLPKSFDADALVRFVAALLAAFASFSLLNRRKSHELHDWSAFPDSSHVTDIRPLRRRSSVTLSNQGAIVRPPPAPLSGLAGRTLDLTLLAAVRAADILVTSAWQRRKSPSARGPRSRMFEDYIERSTLPAIFALSSSLIMWSWFYSPSSLPSAYNTWISSAANIDIRLIEALRQCRYGNFVYGKDTGFAPLLQSMCKDLKYPPQWGDPAKTIPIPCELYHSGSGPSCEWHALERFWKSWQFAMRMYLPLNILMLFRRKPSKRSASRAFSEASRSSAFLAGFIALFYYGVCCARTRIGPKLFSSKTVTPMMWDSGICIGTGCFMCGWSILLENASRRQEIAFFVAPRALGTIIPRRYYRKVRSQRHPTPVR